MYEFVVKIANLYIKITSFYETSKVFCGDYIDNTTKKTIFNIICVFLESNLPTISFPSDKMSVKRRSK